MKGKKLIAAVLAVALVLGLFPDMTMAVSAEDNEPNAIVFNNEGVWITEIYQNDVNRRSDTGGYEDIENFATGEDVLEFIEISSTHEEDIRLNDLYEFYYNSIKLTITDMDGNADVTVSRGQAVVLWNYRVDLGEDVLPTEEQFRSAMRVPDDAIVLMVVTDTGAKWKENGVSFSVKTIEGADVSTFTIPSTTDTYTQDGFSVELQVPDIGSEMLVYRAKTEASAGYVYSGQLNGLVQTKGTDKEVDGLYITEVRPNDTNRCAAYGSAVDQDLMECLEITNTGDEDVVLNQDYILKYFVKESQRKILTLYHFDENGEDGVGSPEGCVVPAGSTAVLWCYRPVSFPTETYESFTSFPTEADFRSAYGISDDVPVYLFIDQNGLSNSNRGFDLFKVNEDGTQTLVSNYIWLGNDDCKDNKSAILAVNPEGPEMLLRTANGATSMGVVDESQITYVTDDGSAIELRLALASDVHSYEDEEVPTSVTQGEEIRVDFYYAATGSLPKTAITTYYRLNGEGVWTASVEGGSRVPYLYEAIISADVLFNAEYVEFYVKASNAYRSTISQVYKVDITKLTGDGSIRTNISEGEYVSGNVSITADVGSEIYIDGVKQETIPMLTDGAYFSFYADGRDSYFKNAITTTENQWISAIGKWQYAISNGQVHHIDNSYFTYNAETDSYDVTLRFWAGTWGATVDEYLYPTGNREDFTVSELQLKLADGNAYLPTAIGPSQFEGVDTSAKTNLSTAFDAVHKIGDSAAMCPYMDVSFSIPANEADAVGTQIDTTAMTEGEHTLTVVNGDRSEEVTFVVDNSAPVIAMGVSDGDLLGGVITLEPTAADACLYSMICLLDGARIEVPYNTTAYALGQGQHILSVLAEDAAGNQTVETVTFTVSNAAIGLDNAETTDITDTSASAYLTLESAYDTEVTFYAADKITGVESAVVDGLLPYIQYTIHVGDVASDAVIFSNWDGQASGADDTHATTMFVLNTATGGWDVAGIADAEGSIAGTFVAENHVSDGIAAVIVQCTADSALPDLDTVNDGIVDNNADWDGTAAPEDYDFSFAWITDTQYYSEQYMWHFESMNNYIVDMVEELKIKYVIHTGDIVDDWDMIYEWENADSAMSIFDETGMPYGVLGGNHDVAAGLGDNENYFTYFGEDRFADQETYGGSYMNNLGHYDLISENGQDFVIVYMSWNIYQEEIDWMNSVLERYSDRKAILCFHPYTNVKESDDGLLDYYGVMIQEQVVEKNPNVFAVLNGHYHGSSYQTVTFDDDGDGVNERIVYQICTDYQSGFEGGTGYIKFLYFDLDNDKVYINSYSPSINDYNYYDGTGVDDLSQLAADDEDGVVYKTGIDTIVLDVDFDTEAKSIVETGFSAYISTGEVLGTAQMNGDGKAEVTLSGLAAETEYAWFVVATNAGGDVKVSKIVTFTTDEAQIVIPDEEETETPDDGGIVPPDEGEAETPNDGENDTPDDGETETPDDGETNTPDDGETEIPDEDNAQTGDNSMMPLIGLLAVAGAVLLGLIVYDIRRQKTNRKA